jgi:hypothetical protein
MHTNPPAGEVYVVYTLNSSFGDDGSSSTAFPERKSLLCIDGCESSPTSTRWQMPRLDDKLTRMVRVAQK